ncbi:MAG: hypothetical protein GY801_47725 [bacterium]|nr:hypothetical protein [bacterium]
MLRDSSVSVRACVANTLVVVLKYDRDAVQTGARQACLISLTKEEARPFAERCISGTEPQRLGAAQIFSRNLVSTQFRSYCEDALLKFFNDPGKDVREKAATCFHAFKGEQLGESIPLVEACVQSAAFTTSPGVLLEALQKTTAKLPAITCRVCERFVKEMESESSDRIPDHQQKSIFMMVWMKKYLTVIISF